MSVTSNHIPPTANHECPVAILGLDAADSLLIGRWVDEGYLPAFANLLRKGSYGILDSTSAMFSGSPWLSIASGCNPAKCGVYTRHQIESGTYKIRRIKAGDLQEPLFWSSFRGPIAVADVPKAPLSPGVDGIQLVEWGAYDHYSMLSSYPADFTAKVVEEFGRHPLAQPDFEEHLHKRRDFDALKLQLLDGIRMKHRFNMAVMRTFQPRFFFSVFGETHAAGHAFWRFQDPRHPLFKLDENCRSAMREVYQVIDSLLEEFIESLPRDYVFILLSGHGFDLDNLAGNLLQEVLIRMGITVPRQEILTYAAYTPSVSLDMTRSKAFCLPTDWHGFIRVNLQGREPEGIVAHRDYETLCEEIKAELLSLCHRHDNTPVVKDVVLVRHVFNGPFIDQLPDLVVIWNTGHIVGAVFSPRCGLIEHRPDLSGGGGNHRGAGFMLAQGPGIGRSRFTGRDLDIAPTICRFLGETPLRQWDGIPLELSSSPSET